MSENIRGRGKGRPRGIKGGTGIGRGRTLVELDNVVNKNELGRGIRRGRGRGRVIVNDYEQATSSTNAI